MGGPTYISGGTSACSRPFTVHRCWPAELNSLCVLRSYPLRGMKFTDYEGGTRVASWVSGGVIPAAQRGTTHSAGLVHIADCACSRVSNHSQHCVDSLVGVVECQGTRPFVAWPARIRRTRRQRSIPGFQPSTAS